MSDDEGIPEDWTFENGILKGQSEAGDKEYKLKTFYKFGKKSISQEIYIYVEGECPS